MIAFYNSLIYYLSDHNILILGTPIKMSYAQNQTDLPIDNTQLASQDTKNNSKTKNDFALAWKDAVIGFGNYKLWTFMGLSEIRRRYRRTAIGPFWTSISLGLFIACMGYLLSAVWHNDAQDFLPYFCSGYICWILIQSIITESCTAFTSSETFIKQVSLPFFTYACLIAWRNIIIFFHHLVILALVMVYAKGSINLNTLLIIPGMMIIFFTGSWVAVFLGMACARFRDIHQIIISLLQLAMFVTPIMWRPEQIGAKGILVSSINPIYHFICLIRLPLLGQAPSPLNWTVALSVSFFGAVITIMLLAKNYRKIVFWL